MSTDRAVITASLAPMFAEARAKGLWFYSPYADIWLCPDELEASQEAGLFVWGASNWKLENPSIRLVQLQQRVENAISESKDFMERVQWWKSKVGAA